MVTKSVPIGPKNSEGLHLGLSCSYVNGVGWAGRSRVVVAVTVVVVVPGDDAAASAANEEDELFLGVLGAMLMTLDETLGVRIGQLQVKKKTRQLRSDLNFWRVELNGVNKNGSIVKKSRKNGRTMHAGVGRSYAPAQQTRDMGL